MTTLTAYDDLPGALLDELTDAGLDPLDVHALVVAALGEDLPTGVDVTSAATISPDARGSGVLAAREAGVVAGLGIAAARRLPTTLPET
jgi:nicotinate-nucleotide pyrophosphorylase (carboxylating)